MAATSLLTSEQFLALPEECDQHGSPLQKELIHGEVVTMPRPAQRHQIVQNNILGVLMAYLREETALPFRAFQEAEYIVTDTSTFIPDISIVAIARLDPEKTYISGAPELAIEVVSPSESASHLRIKTDAYLANGAHSVWIVFPEVRSVMVYTPESIREFKAGQSIADAHLPGFSSPVAAFFELT
jgi:Uma2 family endonuclease